MSKIGAYGQNLLINRLDTKGDTCLGEIVSSAQSDLKLGLKVFYLKYDASTLDLPKDRKLDVIWSQKIRAVFIEE